MRRLLLILALLLGFAARSSLAANLIANGDFETGSFLGWTTSGTVGIDSTQGEILDGSFSADLGDPLSSGTLTQTVATVPGVTYILAYAFEVTGNGSYSVQVSGSSNLVNFNISGPAGQVFLKNHIFTADRSFVTVELIGTGVLVDDISLQSGTAANPGAYTGTVKVTSFIPERNVTASHVETVSARITPGGDLSLLEEPSGTFREGIFVNGGLFFGGEIPFTLKGSALSFKSVDSRSAQDQFVDSSYAVTSTNTFTLHRTGK